MKALLVLFSLLLSLCTLAGQNEASKEAVLGKVLKDRLENYHFSQRKLDDSVSKDAFKLYLKRLDYSKRFFLKTDIVELKKFETSLDDFLNIGSYPVVAKANEIFDIRLKEIEGYVTEIFKTPFDFQINESLEFDPEKRDFPATVTEQKDLWRKLMKFEVLNRYLTMREEIEKSKKDVKEAKAKGEKPKKPAMKSKTEAQMLTEATEAARKGQLAIFKRLGQRDRNDNISDFFNSITAAYDPHTNYLAPKAKEDFDMEMSGSLEGIGAILREDGEYIKVVEIVPGSASWKQGELGVDDMILKVGQGTNEAVDIVGMRLEDAVRLIRGKKGSEVRLNVKKPDGGFKLIPIVRDVVVIEETYAKAMVLENKKTAQRLGYIYLPKFYRDFDGGFKAKNCTDDIKKSIEELKKQNIQGLVLDVRNDSGGSLEDAVKISGLFIDHGPIVQVKDSLGKQDILNDINSSTEYDGPLIIMTNSLSASASEILASALKDYGRALIVGSKETHGKGTVQTVLDLEKSIMTPISLPPLGSLKITIQKFYRINGDSTQFKGISPDIVLPDPLDYADTNESKLDFALSWSQIKPVTFKKWPLNYDIPTLAKTSAKRTEKNLKFQNITKLVRLLKGRKDDTILSLNLKTRVEEDEDTRKAIETYKYDQDNPDITVPFYSDNSGKDPKNDPKLMAEIKKKNEEYEKKVKNDPFIEEVFNLFLDMHAQTLAKGKEQTKARP